jgi:hypothetical protein
MINFITAAIIFVLVAGVLQVYNCLYVFSSPQNNIAYAHFFGATKKIDDNYQIVFQTFPFVPFAGENSTLNFSILDKENANINNVYAALIIKEKETGKIVGQVPYKFYEFSDITFPYKFQNNTRYIASLQAKIAGDSRYESSPMIADFDFSVGSSPVIPFKEVMLYYVIPAVVIVPVGIAFYSHFKKEKSS